MDQVYPKRLEFKIVNIKMSIFQKLKINLEQKVIQIYGYSLEA